MPPRRVIIDGYNLLFRAGRGADEGARQQLVRDAARYRGDRSADVLIVFDARDGSGTTAALGTPGVRVEYARGDADSAIVRAVRRSRQPTAITVMTADRDVADQVKALGATVEDGAGLWESRPRQRRRQSAGPASDKPSGVSDREVEFWLQEFESTVDDDDDW